MRDLGVSNNRHESQVRMEPMQNAGAILLSALAATLIAAPIQAQTVLPTGQRLTPEAAHGAIFQPLNPDLAALPAFTAGQASAVALSPDRRTLLILTSGFNRNAGADGKQVAALSNEYVFVFDLSGAAPVKRQVLEIPNTFLGIAWAPSGQRFYVSAGVDDAVLEYQAGAGGYQPGRRFSLGHAEGLGIAVKPEAAGIAVSPDGRWLLAANLQNDSVSLIDLASGQVVVEQDLRPGKIDPARHGQSGGGYPRAIAWTGPHRAFVTAERDREIVALTVGGRQPLSVTRRIRTAGQPTALLAGPHGRLYAALGNTDAVATLDAATGRILARTPSVATPALMAGRRFEGGANSNALALSPDGRTLYVTNGGENAVAVLALGPPGAGGKAGLTPRFTGLMPTGWYPTGVAAAGGKLYVVNGKSDPGPNPGWCRNTLSTKPEDSVTCRSTNSYGWQLEKAGFLTVPAPDPAELRRLTHQVAVNVGFAPDPAAAGDTALMTALRARIKHVIFIVKENRTYDQLLGDLEVGDGDPKLAIFGRSITPNQHAIARQFVTLDHLYASGESSNTGWNWTTAARTTDFTEREAPVNYADRGLQYDQEGENRNVNVGIAGHRERKAAKAETPDDDDILPGSADVAAPDGPKGEEGQGYVWDAAIRKGLSVRNYGFYGDLSRYSDKVSDRIPPERDPFAKHLPVFITTKPELAKLTDVYFRGFDQGFPDYWRVQEWKREFSAYAAKATLPSLTLLRLAHDHTGNFGKGLDKVDTVETEVADNDYAVGVVLQTLAESRFARDTLVFVIEDDAQDGPDHVSSRRTVALVAGPYVRQHAVVSQPYTTVSFVRTIEAVLGLAPMAMNDALARPMTEIFDLKQARWDYKAEVPSALRTTELPLPGKTADGGALGLCRPLRSAAYWAQAMAGLNFDVEDHLDTPRFNQALWTGMTGQVEPPQPSGADLSQDRTALLSAASCH
jgi:DNA-binding beta-propeller fold protein YncE